MRWYNTSKYDSVGCLVTDEGKLTIVMESPCRAAKFAVLLNWLIERIKERSNSGEMS